MTKDNNIKFIHPVLQLLACSMLDLNFDNARELNSYWGYKIGEVTNDSMNWIRNGKTNAPWPTRCSKMPTSPPKSLPMR